MSTQRVVGDYTKETKTTTLLLETVILCPG
jgi:hypothetical protein